MPVPVAPHLILPILAGAAALGLLASAIYVPSIPDIARELGVPVGQVQLTLTTYLVAFGAATLFVGALSDRFGRRVVLIAGGLVCALASLACALATSIELLLIGRAVQAVGACTGMVVSRAVVRDVFDRDSTARAMAVLAMAVTLAPVLAPVLGGYVHVWLGWRANFVILAVWALASVVLAAWLLPETNREMQTQGGLLRGVLTALFTLLRFGDFLAYALAVACGGVTFYSFIVAVPVILIDRFGVSPDLFGLYIGIPPLGFMTGSYITSRLARRVGPDRMILSGGAGHILSGSLLIALAMAGFAEPWAVIGPLVLMGFSNGLIMANAYAGGVSVQPQLAGAASGLANFVQMGMAGAAAAAFAALTLKSAAPIGVAIAGAGAVILLVFPALRGARKPSGSA
jgi:DHA1 family bicyclomycin/chloramphenicol resistance-like MFS transporter